MVSLGIFFLLHSQSRSLDYDLLTDGKKIGSVKIFTKITSDGGKKVDTKSTLTVNGAEIKVIGTSEWTFEGAPKLKTMQIVSSTGTELKRVMVEFQGEDADITAFQGEESKKTRESIEIGASTNDFGEFWLIRDEPEPKQAYSVMTFDMNLMKWTKTEVKYVGPTIKTIDGMKFSLHHIRRKTESRTDEIFCDEEGHLVISESSDGRVLKRTKLAL